MTRWMRQDDSLDTRSRRSIRRLCVIALVGLLGSAICEDALADDVTWGSTYPTVVGAATTVSLGGGSFVDLTVATGGSQGLSGRAYQARR